MTRVDVSPDLLEWARERAGLDRQDLTARFVRYEQWISGEIKPTLKQLQSFAKAVHVPEGYLFLAQPPEELLPIPDFRTFDGAAVRTPSPNLLDMLFACQERQAWYRDFAQATQQPPREFIGSTGLDMSAEQAAQQIRDTLDYTAEERAACATWEEALRLLVQKADQAGVLVMISGVVQSNNSRKLDLKEFRGFALSDPLAPLLFLNGTDSKSGQMFTLAHELAHLWLNSTAVSNAGGRPPTGFRQEEVWCNAVAAELLVPMAALKGQLRNDEAWQVACTRLSRFFKVSKLVILRRLLDANWLSRTTFDEAWQQELARLRDIAERSGAGGDFYRTTISRVSRRFTQALISSTLEGQTLYRDAFRMLGVSKTKTFDNLGREVGVLL